MALNENTVDIDRLFLKAVDKGIYTVTKRGTVYNNITKKFVAVEPAPSAKYCRVSMSKSLAVSLGWPEDRSASFACSKHRLIYLAFKGDIPEGLIVHHKDGDPTNNALSNLKAVPESYNAKIEYDSGRRTPVGGQDHYAATLMNDEVVDLRWAVVKGEKTVKEIAKEYGMLPNTVSSIINGTSYPNAGGPIDLRKVKTHKVPMTAANEKLLREVVMAFWKKRFKKKRRDILSKREDLSKKEKRSIYVRYDEPQDLSGACKIISQMAFLVFEIEGEVFSNRKHTFILKSDATVYDLNAECEDVKGMKDPYNLDWRFNNSIEAKAGLGSWHTAIVNEILPAFVARYKSTNAKTDRKAGHRSNIVAFKRGRINSPEQLQALG